VGVEAARGVHGAVGLTEKLFRHPHDPLEPVDVLRVAAQQVPWCGEDKGRNRAEEGDGLGRKVARARTLVGKGLDEAVCEGGPAGPLDDRIEEDARSAREVVGMSGHIGVVEYLGEAAGARVRVDARPGRAEVGYAGGRTVRRVPRRDSWRHSFGPLSKSSVPLRPLV